MRTQFKLEDKNISKKVLAEKIGKDEVARILKDAKEAYMENPLIELDYMSRYGTVTVEFIL